MKYFIIPFVLLFSITSQAKDLSNRLGVGYSNALSIDIPAVTLHYHPNAKTSMAAGIGVSTEDDNSKFALLFKLYRTIFEEQNLNFFMGGGAAAISNEVAGVSDSGFELSALFGCEFFFTGLDSLAFRFEAGVGIVSLDNGVTFRTIGYSPLNAGITFYF